LFSGFQDHGKWTQAKASTRAARLSLQILKARISYDLKSAFQGVQYATEYVNLTDDIIHRREENLSMVRLRFQSGRENKGSELLSQAYLNQSRYDNLQARNALNVARAQLARALGADSGAALDVKGEIPLHEPPSPDFKKLAPRTPDYLQAEAQEDAAEAGVTIARSGFFPSLSVIGSVGDQGKSFYPNERDKWSVGVNLTLPLFNGGKDYYTTRAATEARGAADFTRLNSLHAALAKLEQGFAGYTEAVSKLAVDESFKQAAMVRAEIARKKYGNGLLSFEEWDIIENDLIARQKTFLLSRRDRVIAEAGWEQAQGQGVIP
jgi:outer membrane protein TolC